MMAIWKAKVGDLIEAVVYDWWYTVEAAENLPVKRDALAVPAGSVGTITKLVRLSKSENAYHVRYWFAPDQAVFMRPTKTNRKLKALKP